jgi:ATP-binding cassette subfamily F protein uup
LSGGEKRRLHLLSILFRNPNFLILDEPTNDLDLPTLGVLENFLSEFQGCLLIVSHDRYFMDRLVDHLFVFEGEGKIRDFPGNYSQYRDQVKSSEDVLDAATKPAKDSSKTEVKEMAVSNVARKLSYKEKREFEMLGKEITELEKEKSAVTAKLNSGTLPFDELQVLSKRIGEIAIELDEKEMRWLELSEISQS